MTECISKWSVKWECVCMQLIERMVSGMNMVVPYRFYPWDLCKYKIGECVLERRRRYMRERDPDRE